MKAHLNTFLNSDDRSFSIRWSDYYHALSELHYHRELEIVYIAEGAGTLLIGEQLEEVSSGMLIVIGPDVPHMFKFETHRYFNELMKQGKIDLPLKLLTLHVNPDILGERFLSLPENELIAGLLKDASKGMIFQGDAIAPILDLMEKLAGATIHQRLWLLMQLLNTLGENQDRQYITSAPDQSAYNESDENRLTKVYLYTLNNFTKTIALKDVAKLVYMVPNAFCRYFKQRTHKSYFTFLMEVRIRHACKLLKEHDYSIVVVCYESGFSNLSNFNRHFKLLVGKTPLQYRQFFR
ncbi:AraC family transcriptional regulator [Mucilaginibacter mali]|uniref:AraC family transcriptional regulator n=1 Tax=Mucilaginibacter mali TaxID=2740462 RepID=A0A7D4QJ30_9SPHI|nr:AraC family transcriptional regulator [Mucilaginibacter mali]QKJ29470.1 AraC family transcriptional regulator [Mucilaginibacter mali]